MVKKKMKHLMLLMLPILMFGFLFGTLGMARTQVCAAPAAKGYLQILNQSTEKIYIWTASSTTSAPVFDRAINSSSIEEINAVGGIYCYVSSSSTEFKALDFTSTSVETGNKYAKTSTYGKYIFASYDTVDYGQYAIASVSTPQSGDASTGVSVNTGVAIATVVLVLSIGLFFGFSKRKKFN